MSIIERLIVRKDSYPEETHAIAEWLLKGSLTKGILASEIGPLDKAIKIRELVFGLLSPQLKRESIVCSLLMISLQHVSWYDVLRIVEAGSKPEAEKGTV